MRLKTWPSAWRFWPRCEGAPVAGSLAARGAASKRPAKPIHLFALVVGARLKAWLVDLSHSRKRIGWTVLTTLTQSRLVGVIFVLMLLTLWQVAATTGLVDTALLPPVSTILQSGYDAVLHGALLSALGESLVRMITGYIVAALVGITLGVLMGRLRFVYILLEPLIELLRPVPIPAFIPLLILFLGIESSLKVAIVFVGAFFPILISSFAGVRAVPRTMRETASVFGLTWWQTVREVTMPAAAPVIFVGLRTSLAIALIVEVVSEMIAGTGGIGYYVLQAEEGLHVVGMYVGIFTLALVGYAINMLFLLIERTVLHWHSGVAQHGRN
jgi:ABC-type nitrate/sulfonate/bicarbonate transport system permease component